MYVFEPQPLTYKVHEVIGFVSTCLPALAIFPFANAELKACLFLSLCSPSSRRTSFVQMPVHPASRQNTHIFKLR